MLKRRLIPKLQFGLRSTFRGPKPVLVITRNFSNKRFIGDPLSQAKIYEAQLVDELILVDLERTSESWDILLETVDLLSLSLATPLSVGGGVYCFDQIQSLLDRGADKVILNSAAIDNPSLIDRAVASYGSQCVVLSVDAKSHGGLSKNVWTNCGQLNSGLDVVEWCVEAVDRGVGEVLITSIDHDGLSSGLDLSLTSQLCRHISVPVIVSGGCGLSQHFVEGFEAGASAVSAGTFFCQRDQNPMQCRSHIRNAGFPIRLEV